MNECMIGWDQLAFSILCHFLNMLKIAFLCKGPPQSSPPTKPPGHHEGMFFYRDR